MSDCYCFESVEDGSSGIYQRCGDDKWQLVAIINPDAAERQSHDWPKFAKDAEVSRWKCGVTYHRAKLEAAFMLAGEEA